MLKLIFLIIFLRIVFVLLLLVLLDLMKNTLVIPCSNSFKKNHKKISIKIPPILLDKKIKEIKIIPKFMLGSLKFNILMK